MTRLCAAGIALASARSAGVALRRAESAAARRLDDEHVAAVHVDLEGRAEFFPGPAVALDPVPSRLPRVAARQSERRHTPAVGEHHRGHRLEKAHAALAA